MRKLYLLTACICLGWTVKAQDSLQTFQLDEVVITGTKSELPVEKSGKTIFKISRRDIERSAAQTVGDVLNNVPGVQINGNLGALGSDVNYSVRGANSKSTLVLIDGVPMNDPSQISNFYDFRLLDLNQVESIEILKGGLSTLYGTGAAAGVINITTKKATSGLNGSADASYGSFNTVRHGFNVGEKTENVNWSLSAGFQESDGFSAAKDTADANFDKDGFLSNNVKALVGISPSDRFKVDVTAGYDQMELDFDNGAYLDGNNTSNDKRYSVGISPTFKYDRGKIVANFFYIHNDRLFDFNGFEFQTKGFNHQVDVFADHTINDQLKIIGGINYQQMSYGVVQSLSRDTTDFNIIDPYVSLIFDSYAGFNVQIGGRLNNHSEYGSNFIYNINPSYRFQLENNSYVKLYSSYSTSFVTPGPFQLYDPFSGVIDLEPEESENLEFGIGAAINNIGVNISYFNRTDENLIDFDNNTFVYFNRTQEQQTNGLEISGNVSLMEALDLNLHYTWIESPDTILFRVPEHKYGLGLSYGNLQTIQVGLNYLFIGERNDTNPASTEGFAELEGVNLLDLKVAKSFKGLTASFVIDNLTNEEYEYIRGFNARERNYRVSLTYQFSR